MNASPTRRRFYWHPASVVAAAVLWTIGVGQGLAPVAAADSAVGWRSDSLRPTDSWNTLSFDVSVTRRHVGKSGTVVGAPIPTAAYRVERSSLSGGWKTVVRVLAVDRSPAYTLGGAIAQVGSFPVARIEDDENGSPVRAYDKAGSLLTPFASPFTLGLIAPFSPARSIGREWIDGLVPPPTKKTLRLQRLERQFGLGSAAGVLSRYARQDGDLSQEVLVDPVQVVPIEHNKTRAGKRIVHRRFTYLPAPGGAVVRTSMHTETLLSPATDERAVVDTTFSNIRLEQRR